MNIPSTTIQKISKELTDFSFCYIHKETLEAIIIPEDDYGYEEFLIKENAISELSEYKLVQENSNNYYRIESMPYSVLRRILKDFIDKVPSQKAKEELSILISNTSSIEKFQELAVENGLLDWFPFYHLQRNLWIIREIEKVTKISILPKDIC